MTNKTEDEKLSTESYQHLIAVGIANGIDQYFKIIGLKAAQMMLPDQI